MLGDGRLLGTNDLHKEILCIIRGKLRKRVWINIGDIILISYRDFQTSKADVIGKYTDDEVSQLKKYGELSNIQINNINTDGDEEDCFDFSKI